MNDKLDSIEKSIGRNYESPPLHLWHPPLSGDIDIRIDREGCWWHEGDEIKRESIVRLFASILRREDDGEYYLVTPGEKWRIQVELQPLIVTDVSARNPGPEQWLEVTLNTGRQVIVDASHRLFLEPTVDGVAAVGLDHGLAALFSRSAWYRLVELAEGDEPGVWSKGEFFSLVES